MTTKNSPEAGNLGAEDEDAGNEIDASMLPQLTESEAARLTQRIQLRLDMMADSIELVIPMIAAAKNGNAHQALGYESWTAYVADKFGGVLARLTKSERLPFVEMLADPGMSTRAIASVVGTSHQTVANDMAGAPVKNLTPRLAGDAEEQPVAALTETGSQDDLSGENVVSIITRNITGIDGKSYSRPAPLDETKPRRRPLPDAYWRAVHDLQKSVERLERLHANERFVVERKALRDREWRRLSDLQSRLLDLDGDLYSTNKCRECDVRLVPGDGEPLRNRCEGGCG